LAAANRKKMAEKMAGKKRREKGGKIAGNRVARFSRYNIPKHEKYTK
jgi:hypothetical protein